jgi:hypothetical protein
VPLRQQYFLWAQVNGVRMAVKDEFASRDQRVNVVADANVNHAAL